MLAPAFVPRAEVEPEPEAETAMPPRRQRKKLGRLELEGEGTALMPSMRLPCRSGGGRSGGG
jgi:hypothetical protein